MLPPLLVKVDKNKTVMLDQPALLLRPDGDTKDDFRIISQGRSVHVLNAPSPAPTAALAIGDHIADAAEAQGLFG